MISTKEMWIFLGVLLLTGCHSPGVANLFLQTCQNIISDVKPLYNVPVTLKKLIKKVNYANY